MNVQILKRISRASVLVALACGLVAATILAVGMTSAIDLEKNSAATVIVASFFFIACATLGTAGVIQIIIHTGSHAPDSGKK